MGRLSEPDAAPARVELGAVDADGQPVTGSIDAAAEAAFRSLRFRVVDGACAPVEIPPGKYFLTVPNSRLVVTPQVLEVRAATSTRHVVRLVPGLRQVFVVESPTPEGVWIRTEVRDRAGERWAHAILNVRSGGCVDWSCTLPPGGYTARFTLHGGPAVEMPLSIDAGPQAPPIPAPRASP